MENITERLIRAVGSAPAREPVVTILGDLNFDHIYSCPALEGGKEVIISSFSREIAGAAGIVACGLARLSATVYLLSELGDDTDGRELYEEITRRGVQTEGIRLLPQKRSPFTLIFSAESQGKPRQAATFQGTLTDFSARPEHYKEFVARSVMAYSCSYFLIPKLREDIAGVFRLARSREVQTAYDANAGDGWEDRKNLATLTNTIYPLTDVVLLNESEARFLTGCDDPAKSAILVSPSSATVVIKLGPRGAVLRHRGRFYRVSAFPIRGRIEDTVGAGDAFQAAFLYYYVRKFPIEIGAVMGSANAASTLAFKGGVEGQLDGRGLAAAVRCCSVFDRGGGVNSIQR